MEELQEDRWNDACGELGPVVSEAYQFVCRTDNDHEPEELRDGRKASVILRRILDDRADLGDLEDKLESIDKPKQAYRDCRQHRKRAVWFFFGAGAGFGVSSTIVWLAPEKTIFTAVEASFITISVLGVTTGVLVAYLSSNARTRLDEMTEDKDFM